MLRRRSGRSSLIGTMARTAVISGTATVVSNKVSARQHKAAQKSADAQQAQLEAAAQQAVAKQHGSKAHRAAAGSSGMDETITQLQKLGELLKAGILTKEEFAGQKAKILAR